MLETLQTALVFIIMLSVLVLIHELGHFLVAKKFGIKVEEFGIGFPPRAYGKKIGETVYSINWLPVGGFVKLYGEDDAGGGKITKANVEKTEGEKVDLARAFYARPLWQRISVVVAGVVMNFILAVVIISFLFSTNGVPLPSGHVIVTGISANSPAAISGLKEGDRIVSMNGQELSSTEIFIKSASELKGKEVSLVVLRDNKEFSTKLTPRVNPPEGEGSIGVVITTPVEIKKYAIWEAPFYGTIEAAKFSWMILGGLGDMIFGSITRGTAPEGVAGPLGVAQLTGEAVKAGPVALLWFAALLSLNLAVLNIMPIPALDGGRFFFMLIELVTRRKVNPKYEAYAHGVGLVLLLGLMLIITFVDVSRLVQGKSILP